MIQINKLLLTTTIFISVVNANGYFSTHEDICDLELNEKCTNDTDLVQHLQHALNKDKKLDLNLVTDGKWGENTKEAVIAFQKKHQLSPADGWVGKSTKVQLDKLSTKTTARHKVKNYFIKHDDMCEGTDTHQCTNDYNSVRNLQIALSKDKKIHKNLISDGKWGKATKEAVIAFQEAYTLDPADGWVGKATKIQLDKIAKNIQFPKDKKLAHLSSSHKRHFTSYNDFRRNINLRKSFKVYRNKKLLSRANRRNTKLKVDISDQRINLLVNGKVALSSPCTTGAKHKFEPNTKIYRDKHTPKGTFRILEKIADKRSTIFGDYYRGNKRVYHGDRRKFRGCKKGLHYKGASLKNWMRLTSAGVGLHASKYVKRYPGTNGCIRLPYNVAKTIFKKVRRGTKVRITQ